MRSGVPPTPAKWTDTVVNRADPTAIRMFVRSPAGFCRISRSSPVAAPSPAASSKRTVRSSGDIAGSTIERVDDAVVYLVPLGRNRYELYSEPPDDDEPEPSPAAGALRRWFARIGERWRATVHAARRTDTVRGRFAHLRDWAVCRVAESVAEQRTLWSLRSITAVELRYAADL